MTEVREVSFSRRPDVLWRSIGEDLLALPHEGQPVLVGGGGAVLWRLLDRPLGVSALVSELAAVGAGPATTDVVAALEQMQSHGLVERHEP